MKRIRPAKIIFLLLNSLMLLAPGAFCAKESLVIETYLPAPSTEFSQLITDGNLGIGTANPASKLDINGSFAVPVTVPDINGYVLKDTDCVILDAPGYDLSLPAASSRKGRRYIVKNNSAGNITVQITAVGDTIDGAGSKTLTAGQKIQTVSDGVNSWLIISD